MKGGNLCIIVQQTKELRVCQHGLLFPHEKGLTEPFFFTHLHSCLNSSQTNNSILSGRDCLRAMKVRTVCSAGSSGCAFSSDSTVKLIFQSTGIDCSDMPLVSNSGCRCYYRPSNHSKVIFLLFDFISGFRCITSLPQAF